MKTGNINKVSDLREYTVSRIAAGLRKSFDIDPEYAIMFAWYVNHSGTIPERSYNTIYSNLHKIENPPTISQGILALLRLCYNNKISLLPV